MPSRLGADVEIPAVHQEPAHKFPETLSYTIDGAMRATGLGRSKLYQLMGDGTLAKVKVGRRTLIRAASIRSLIDGEGN